MGLNGYVVIGSAVVGLLVGLTGAGRGGGHGRAVRAAGGYWLVRRQPWRRRAAEQAPALPSAPSPSLDDVPVT